MTTQWAYNSRFQGTAALNNGEEWASTTVDFHLSKDIPTLPPGATDITPLMVAEALSNLLVANGWPPAQFFGTPKDEPLNVLAQ